MKPAEVLRQKIEQRKAVVGVMGLGYVGLPLVREFCTAGVRVIGFDVDQRKVRMLKAGQTYIEHLPGAYFKGLIQQRRFRPTENMDELARPDVILI